MVKHKMTDKILSFIFGVITAFTQILGLAFPIVNTLTIASYTLTKKDEATETVKLFIVGLIIGEVIQLMLKLLKL